MASSSRRHLSHLHDTHSAYRKAQIALREQLHAAADQAAAIIEANRESAGLSAAGPSAGTTEAGGQLAESDRPATGA